MASDSTTFFYPHRTAASGYRMPTPPRIVVPPPALDTNFLSNIIPQTNGTSADDAAFLQALCSPHLTPRNQQLEWTYEQRRDAQPILPYLYLGPMTAAKNEPFLRRAGITSILAIRQKQTDGGGGPGAFESKLMTSTLNKASLLGLQTAAIDILSPADLVRTFPQTSAIISSHVRAHYMATEGREVGRVLVFCESGNERSAAVVAAYLMDAYQNVDHIRAMQLCQASRFCVNFDDAGKRLLQGYWDLLCARRGVAAAAGMGTVPVKHADKRSLQRDDDGDGDTENVDMDEDDMERFGGRSFAPFVDYELLAD